MVNSSFSVINFSIAGFGALGPWDLLGFYGDWRGDEVNEFLLGNGNGNDFINIIRMTQLVSLPE